MPETKRKLRWLALMLLIGAPACTPIPDISGVEMAFASGSTGSGAVKPSSRLAQSAFGKRVKAAIETSPDLAASNERINSANAAADAAKGAFLPQVSLGINARSERVDSDIADVTPFLRVSQLVYDGGAASGALTASKARILESRGYQLQTAAAIALSAIEAYIVVLDQRELLDITGQNVAVHQEIVSQIAARSAQGAGSAADELTARSRMADAKTRFADAKARLDRAEAQFHEVFGQAPNDLPPKVTAPMLDRTDRQIVLDSPQVRRADASVIAAQAELSAALARRNPGITIAGFADRDVNNDANFGVDLSFNYELDSTGQRRASISAAEAQVKEAEFARQSLIREIQRELEFIRSDQQAGAERLKSARAAVTANAQSVSAAREQFTIGRRSLIEILDAQRDYVNAQERLILAEQNYFLTNYAVLSLTGDILDLLGVTVAIPGAVQ